MAAQLTKKRMYTMQDYASLLEAPAEIEVDSPRQFVSRITLARPGENNRMGHVMRAQLLNQLQLNDQDPDVRVTIIRGAGEHFCSGQDVARSRGTLPFFTNESDGQISRNIVETWFSIMDLGKPVIAQIHGDCLGSGMELAAACDIVYAAEDVRIGYPEGRNMGLPDLQIYPWMCGMRNALSIMLLAETMDGPTSVTRGFSTRAYPVEELEERTLEMADRVARIPADLLAYNKRSVHRAFEAQGMRANLRHGVDLEALMFHASSGNILTRAAAQGGARVTAVAPSRTPPKAAPQPPLTSKAAPKPPSAPMAASKPPSTPVPRPAAAKAAPAQVEPAAVHASLSTQAPPPPARSSRISTNPTQTSTARPATSEPAPSAVVAASSPMRVQQEMPGVHVHLHEPVTIHIHQGGEADKRSKL